jgi:hypothetical protein
MTEQAGHLRLRRLRAGRMGAAMLRRLLANDLISALTEPEGLISGSQKIVVDCSTVSAGCYHRG